jgi:NADH dehydrogenase
MQAGRFVAAVIRARVEERPVPAFRYRNKGNLATIGRNAAVADLPWIRLSGWLAWVMWLVVHLFFIILFDNRVMVLFQWAWNYWTRNRSSRLITGEAPQLFREPAHPQGQGTAKVEVGERGG